MSRTGCRDARSPGRRSPEVFIAYATADRAWALALRARLGRFHGVFLDVIDIQAGDRWPEKIRSAEHHAVMTVVLVSRRSRHAYYQYDEIVYAVDAYRRQHLTLVPVYLERWPGLDDVPYGLRQLQGILWTDKRRADDIAGLLSRHMLAWRSRTESGGGPELQTLEAPPWLPRATDYFLSDPELPPLLHGLAALSTNAALLIQNFLAWYLGTSAVKVPFGGRGTQLGEFDRWLQGEDGPACRLLTAPAGQGKSAFLVHWAASVQASGAADVAFVPISARFQTNVWSVFLPALTARLAAIHRIRLPPVDRDAAAEWKAAIARLVRQPPADGRRLLVVLDGLDEAADWQPGPDIFPLDAPPHVRVVVSARTRPAKVPASVWLRLLGWDRTASAEAVDLPPLRRADIGDVLRSMGAPLDELVHREAVIAELHRLSGGDPLVLRLYVDHLWSLRGRFPTITPQFLRAMKPGIDGYFEDWWSQQEALWRSQGRPVDVRAVSDVLAALGCAFGPLRRDDLARLVGQPDGDVLWRALAALGRFIVGDGDEHGYVFGHPRFASYVFEQRLLEHERRAWDERFVAWGERFLDPAHADAANHEPVPAYLLRYLGAHLRRLEVPPEQTLRLLQPAWCSAFEILDGHPAGFLAECAQVRNDLMRGNTAALDAGAAPPHLAALAAVEVRAGSVVARHVRISGALALDLVRAGVWTELTALAHARQPRREADKLVILEFLFDRMVEPWRSEIAREFLDVLGGSRASVDMVQHAVQMWRKQGLSAEIRGRLEAFIRHCVAIARSNFEAALRAALEEPSEQLTLPTRSTTLDYPQARLCSALAALAHVLPHATGALVDEAADLVLRIAYPVARHRAIAAVAPLIVERPALQHKLVRQELAWTAAMPVLFRNLATYAEHVSEDVAAEMFEGVDRMGSWKLAIDVCAALIPRLRAGLRDRAIDRLVDTLREGAEPLSPGYLRQVVAVAPQWRQTLLDAIPAQVPSWFEESDRLRMAAELSPPAEACRLLRQVMEVQSHIDDTDVLVAAIASFPRIPTDLLAELEARYGQPGGDSARDNDLDELDQEHAHALAALATHVDRQTAIAYASQAFSSMGHVAERMSQTALASLVALLPDATRQELLDGEINTWRMMSDHQYFVGNATLVAELLHRLPTQEADGHIAAIQEAASGAPHSLASILAILARRLEEPLATRLRETALGLAQRPGQQIWRGLALIAVADVLRPRDIDLLSDRLRRIHEDDDAHIILWMAALALAASRQRTRLPLGILPDEGLVRTFALQRFLPHLSPAEQRIAVHELVETLSRDGEDPRTRIAIEAMIPRWGQPQRYDLFCQLLRLVARGRLGIALIAPLLGQVTHALGGDELCEQVVTEIWRAGAWWP
ncbi:MAG TPA: toll/interleukin-1 receptor domain-containing protein [Kofleriaceae bacterium]